MPPEQVVEAWIPTLFTKSASIEVIDETAAIMSEFHPVGMRSMLLAFAEADLREMLPTIEVPTLLLYGEVGHMTHLEAPETFNAEVRSFLRANQN